MLIRFGLALFVIKAFAFLIHACKPHRKAAGAKVVIVGLLFLGWFIALNVFRYRNAGRNCATEYLTGADTRLEPYISYYDVGLFLWRSLVALYVFGALGCICVCVTCFCARRRNQF